MPSRFALLNDSGIGKGYDATKKARALAAARRVAELAAPPDRHLALLALAHHGLGQSEAARTALARARAEYRPGDMRIMDDARQLIERAIKQIDSR